MVEPVIFQQGALRITRDGDVIVVVVGAMCEARIAAEEVSWIHKGDDGAVGIAEVVVEAILRRRQGGFHLHAGVVESGGVATVIAGASGAGKTTTTLALGSSPDAVLRGDDVAFASLVRGTVVVEASPRALHVGAATQQMFPGLVVRPDARTSLGKAIVEGTPPTSTPIPAGRLVFPVIGDVAVTTAITLPPAEALTRLMVASASVAWPLPGTDAHLDVLGRLATLPAVTVTLGRDALADPSVIHMAVTTAGDRR